LSNAVEGLPPPSGFALEIEAQVIDGLITPDEAVRRLIQHEMGEAAAQR